MPETPMPVTAARNPRALAEVVLGRPIDWSQVDDPRQFLEDVLQTPYEELYDPKHDSPVYLGFRVDDHGQVVEHDPDLPVSDERHDGDGDGGSDMDRFPALDIDEIRHLADLKTLLGVAPDEVPVRRIAPSRAGGWTIEVGPGPMQRAATLGRLFDKAALGRIWDPRIFDTGWTPDHGQWRDTGQFFRESAEYFDPIQGGLGDCWLIAAMSSVAWALPYTFAQRSRATGPANEQFTNLIEFHDPANGSTHRFEATDETLVWAGTSSPMYGHSSETGEIWPAIIEKAYAMWRGGTTNDHPNLTVLNGGDPVHASAALIGKQPHYTGTAGSSTTDLINLVKSNSVSYRTINPMTAWTYGSADDAPDRINYADANLVACHAYSVLGWATGPQLLHLRPFDKDLIKLLAAEPAPQPGPPVEKVLRRDRFDRLDQLDLLDRFDASRLHFDPDLVWQLRQDYIVLRNPWGYHEATAGALSGVIPMRDVSFWRSIDLNPDDGVFAIDVPTFKRYFAGIGVAK